MSPPPDSPESVANAGSYRPRWPERLVELSRNLAERGEPRYEQARSEFWLLVNTAIQERLRIERTRVGPVNDDDLVDLAADKSLELMNQFDSEQWEVETPEKLTAFISTVARNGLIDHLRRGSRRATDPEENMDALPPEARKPRPAAGDASATVERDELVRAIVNCASKLKPLHRKVWMFRVFLEMPSKRIARHPEINLTPVNVDVMLQRCRNSLSACARKAGHDISELPPGTFAALWRAFRMDEFSSAK